MKVRLRHRIAGTRNGQDWPPAGTVIDLPDGEAEDLVAAGLADDPDAPDDEDDDDLSAY